MKTAKILELVEVLKEMFLPLTKTHANSQQYVIDPETSLSISPTSVNLRHMMFSKQHLEIHATAGGDALLTLYSDFDDSFVDQLIIDVVDFYNSRLTEKALIEKLKMEREKIDFKIKSLEK